MRRITIEPHLTKEEIIRFQNTAPSARQFQRWQTIHLAMTGIRAEDIARIVGISKDMVYQWVHLYNRKGPDAYVLKERGGDRRSLLSGQQRQELSHELREQASRGELVTAHDLLAAVEAKLGRTPYQGYLHRLLRKMDWRKVAPRPRHPKQDLAAQEDFKKNFPS